MNERSIAWAEPAAFAKVSVGRWPLPFFSSKPRFARLVDQSFENRSHRLCHPQGIGGQARARTRALCHLPKTAGELCRRELVAGRHGALELGSASRGDHLIQRILRRMSQAIQ